MKKTVLLLTLLIGAACSSDKASDPVTPPVAETLTPENAHTFLADAQASDETVALFYNLIVLSRTRFAVGQHDAFRSFYQNEGPVSDIQKTTGSDPALLGSDFMFITDKNNDGMPSNWFHQQERGIISDVKAAYAKGMINVFCWHLREPYHEASFYAADMTADEKATAFKSILPGGAKHDWYKAKLDKVAAIFQELKDASGRAIPVVFRPFHEFDGNWFWWGAAYCTPEEYKQAFRFTVTYLRDVKQVHNVLYAFSPDRSYGNEAAYLSRYPGDDVVDVLGMDNYGDFDAGTSGLANANAKLRYLSLLARNRTKIAALTETGYAVSASSPAIAGWFSDRLYPALTENDVRIAWVMFWSNSENAYYVPPPSAANAGDLMNFSNKAKAVLADGLPDLYHMP